MNTNQSNVSYAVNNGIKKVYTARKYARVLKCDILDILDY